MAIVYLSSGHPYPLTPGDSRAVPLACVALNHGCHGHIKQEHSFSIGTMGVGSGFFKMSIVLLCLFLHSPQH